MTITKANQFKNIKLLSPHVSDDLFTTFRWPHKSAYSFNNYYILTFWYFQSITSHSVKHHICQLKKYIVSELSVQAQVVFSPSTDWDQINCLHTASAAQTLAARYEIIGFSTVLLIVRLFFHLSAYLSDCQSVYPTVSLFIRQSVCLSNCQSIHLTIRPSIGMSICQDSWDKIETEMWIYHLTNDAARKERLITFHFITHVLTHFI